MIGGGVDGKHETQPDKQDARPDKDLCTPGLIRLVDYSGKHFLGGIQQIFAESDLHHFPTKFLNVADDCLSGCFTFDAFQSTHQD
ncbi:MAG: hypothetical protein ACK5EA_02700, partial [Planctomycetaceae bacterium]